MAGEGRKVFSDGEVLSAADVNDYLMDQAVMRFADSAARSSAIGTPTEGMVTYLDDVNQIEVYDGTAWVDQQAPILSEGTAGQYLQSNGTAGSQWVDLEIADDIITTEGDLIVGGTAGVAERLGIGAVDTVLTSDGTAVSWAAAGGGGGGFDTIDIVTASNSSYDVSAISGYARITIIGAGGGGAFASSGSAGGSSSVDIGGVVTTATGGAGGTLGGDTPSITYSFGSFNGGSGYASHTDNRTGSDGNGGEVKVIYADLTGVSTIDITIGAGGSAVRRSGFRGEVHLEYAA